MPLHGLQEGGAWSRLNASPLTVSAGASAVYGAWTQLVASCPFDTMWVMLEVQGGASEYLIDVGIGPVGSEVAVLPQIGFSGVVGGTSHVNSYSIPFTIPMGERISIRAMTSNAVAQNLIVNLYATYAGFLGEGEYTVGVGIINTASAVRGSVIDPGAVANTKGAWVTLATAGVVGLYFQYILLFVGTNQNAQTVSKNWSVDIAIGAAGSEQLVIPDIRFYLDVGYKLILPSVIGPIPWMNFGSARIAARASCDSALATERIIYVHGLAVR